MAPPRDPTVPLEFARLVTDKRLIEAIKWLRARDGLDLQTAKARLDGYLATGKLELDSDLGDDATLRDASRGGAICAQARTLAGAGRVNEAIRVEREASGRSLAEAKRVVDDFIEADPILRGRVADERRTRTRRIIAWVLVGDAIALAALAYYFLTE
jgi:ribosomal protein L7/L12